MLHSPQQATGGGLESSWHRAEIFNIAFIQPAVRLLGKICSRLNVALTCSHICCASLCTVLPMQTFGKGTVDTSAHSASLVWQGGRKEVKERKPEVLSDSHYWWWHCLGWIKVEYLCFQKHSVSWDWVCWNQQKPALLRAATAESFSISLSLQSIDPSAQLWIPCTAHSTVFAENSW